MCIDLKRDIDARMRMLPWLLLIWILLLPFYYAALRKIAEADTEPEPGVANSCLGLPASREEARLRLTRIHIWLLVIGGIIAFICIMANFGMH